MKFISILDIIYSLWQRRKFIFLSVLVFLIVAIFYVLITKPIYNPTAIVKINVFEVSPRWASEISRTLIVPMTPVDRVGSEVEVIKLISGDILREKGVNLDFNIPKELLKIQMKKTIVDTIKKDLKFNLKIKNDSIYVFENKSQLCSGLINEEIRCSLFAFRLEKISNIDRELEGTIVYKNYPKTIDYWLKHKVIINQEGITDLVRITVFDENKFYASEIANSIANKYIDWTIERERKIAYLSLEQLEDLLKQFDYNIDSLKNIADKLRLDSLTLVSYMFMLEFKSQSSSYALADFIRKLISDPNNSYLREVISRFYTKDIDYAKLNNEIVNYLAKRDTILSYILNGKITMAKTVSSAYVLSYAVPPYKPKWPNKPLILITSLLIGILFGVILSVVYDVLEKRIWTIVQLKRYTYLENVNFFYNVKDLKLYILSRPKTKFHFSEKFENFESYSKDIADEYVLVIRRPIDAQDYLNLQNQYLDKKCNIVLL
ncbi:MAG: Wzz/FepE/Etk N-terminal domain-containing protein [candidate division WOR-3 bacterium]